MPRHIPTWGRWLLLGLSLGFGLLIGSGVLHSTPTTPTKRAAAIDARLKAPDSQGLSVAQSNSAAAGAVRHEVRAQVDQGRSDEEIIASLEARYGNAVLLTPPGGGLASVLWIVPAVLVVAIAAAVIVVARGRRLGQEVPGG